MAAASSELGKYEMFDYIVFNDDAEQAIGDVLDIINAEKRKVKNNVSVIKQLLGQN